MNNNPDTSGQRADQDRGNVIYFDEYKSGVRHRLPASTAEKIIEAKHQVNNSNPELVTRLGCAIESMERLLVVYSKLTGSTLFNIKIYRDSHRKGVPEDLPEPEKTFYKVLLENDHSWMEMLDVVNTIIKEWQEGLKSLLALDLLNEHAAQAIAVTTKIDAMMAVLDYSWAEYASLYVLPRKKALEAIREMLEKARHISTNYVFD